VVRQGAGLSCHPQLGLRTATPLINRSSPGQARLPGEPFPRLSPISDYAVKNLLEIDDSFGGGDIEARFSRKYIDSEELGVSLFRYAAGKVATDGHHHREQEEAYVVVSGSGRIKLDDEVVELKVFDVVRVAPHVVRAFEAGPEGLEIVAVGGRKPEEGDGVLDKGRWPAE
jgi:mannose-6-phosphate isomerase-like protein (cupin superfamily)